MRKVIVIGCILASAIASSFGQIANGGFETWTDDCTLDNWFISTICGVVTPVTKTTDAHSGSFAVRGEVVQLFTQAVQPVIQSGSAGEGLPIQQRYTNVTCFYRFTPVGGDRFGLNVAFYKGDAVIAQGAGLFPATTGTAYSQGKVTMTYTTADVPDRAIVQAMIIGPVTGSDFHVGSVMYLDDIGLNMDVAGGDGPTLTIRLNGNTATVSWGADASGYQLQQTSSLVSPNWTIVPGLAPTDTSYSFTVTTGAYFRLIK